MAAYDLPFRAPKERLDEGQDLRTRAPIHATHRVPPSPVAVERSLAATTAVCTRSQEPQAKKLKASAIQGLGERIGVYGGIASVTS